MKLLNPLHYLSFNFLKQPVLVVFFILPFVSQAQKNISDAEKDLVKDSVALLAKADSVQLANYTPKPGKNGKDVDFLFELLSLGALNRNGKDGSNGPELTVQVRAVHLFGLQLLQVSIPVPGSSNTDQFYVNPAKGQLKIFADGSDGGKPGISSKGFRGEAGRAGKGGSITVLLDSNAAAFMRCRCLVFSNNEGNGSNSTKRPEDELLLSNGQLLQPYNNAVIWKLVKAAD